MGCFTILLVDVAHYQIDFHIIKFGSILSCVISILKHIMHQISMSEFAWDPNLWLP